MPHFEFYVLSRVPRDVFQRQLVPYMFILSLLEHLYVLTTNCQFCYAFPRAYFLVALDLPPSYLI